MLPERPLAFTQRPGFLGGRTVDDALESLRLDGFIRIDDWGMLDMEALTKEVNEMLHGTKGGSNLAGAQLQRFGHPAALDSLMNDESLAHLMREYSGGTMRYEGTSVVHLQPGKTGSKTYSPVEWHHDRCGRRLKAFVFLKDVVPESYPTQIATGTNICGTTGMVDPMAGQPGTRPTPSSRASTTLPPSLESGVAVSSSTPTRSTAPRPQGRRSASLPFLSSTCTARSRSSMAEASPAPTVRSPFQADATTAATQASPCTQMRVAWRQAHRGLCNECASAKHDSCTHSCCIVRQGEGVCRLKDSGRP
jgi:hypothetical protein